MLFSEWIHRLHYFAPKNMTQEGLKKICFRFVNMYITETF